MTKLSETTAGLLLILLAAAGTGLGSPLAAQTPGRIFRDCEVCPEMVVVPPGSFMMGSPDAEAGRDSDEGPQHRVTIDYAFAVGVYEVTFAASDACAREGGCDGHEPGDGGWGRGRRPVINVSWNDAWRYADWLTAQTGEEYRLLSEAGVGSTWRARGRRRRGPGARASGSSVSTRMDTMRLDMQNTRFPGIRSVAGTGRRIRRRWVHIGPTASGLYDVLGNVWEWVDDCWNSNYEGAPFDGSAWYVGDCSRRVLRGGSWFSEPDGLRSAERVGGSAGNRGSSGGFRLARTIN